MSSLFHQISRYHTLFQAILRYSTLFHAILRYPTLFHAILRYPTLSFVVLSCPTLLYISLCYPTLSYSPTTLLIFPQRCKPRRLQQKDNTILRYLTLFSMEPTCNDAPELVEDFFATGSISERFPFPRASPGFWPPRARNPKKIVLKLHDKLYTEKVYQFMRKGCELEPK